MTKKKDPNELFSSLAQEATKTHKETVDKVLGNGSDERATSLVSMTKAEKERLTKIAKTHGLNLSAFFRLAANEYISTHDWETR